MALLSIEILMYTESRGDGTVRARVFLGLGMLGFLVGAPAIAHHAFAAEFDASKAVRLTGALTKIEWTNPHTFFYIEVKDDSGNIVKWGCEAASPGSLSRRGFKRTDLKLGDTIVVDGY